MHYVNLKVDETFKIVNEAGEEIEVMLVEIKNSWVAKLGITAPRSVRVLRSELLERESGVSVP